MTLSRTGRYLLVGLLVLPLLTHARSTDTRPPLAEALEAARQQQWSQLSRLEQQLGDHHPLQGYLDFHRLRARLAKAPVEEVLAYLRRYDDSPLSESMRRLAMEQYGQQQRWRDLQAVSAGVPSLIPLRCHYHRALLEDEPEQALAEARSLWLSGQSRPPACDPLFDALRQAGQLNDELVWQRLLLASRAGNDSLMRYLRSLLSDPVWQARAGTLLSLHRQPQQVRYLENGDRHSDIATVVLERLAEQQPEQARRVLPMLAKRLSMAEEQQERVRQRIAWFSVIREVPENRAWVDDYLGSHHDVSLLEQRTRRAVIEQDWDGVARWIRQLPAREQDSARWQYWLGRALEARQQPQQAQKHFARAADMRSFWGFLAAERLEREPALNNQPSALVERQLSERSERVLARVDALLQLGESGHAREEWLFLLRHLDDQAEQDQLARIALQRGWSHLAIETALQAGRHDQLDWRFPLDRKDLFVSAAERHGTDPWLLMAVARRESAFNPQARSSAGALGLMQLMPGTARDMARLTGKSLRGNHELFEPAINIELGSRYLARLLERYNGNRILALAAYNAGPQRVDRWLEESRVPFDVFIEAIPFHETREYVQAVLTYRVILSRHQHDTPLLALLEERETSRPYSAMMLAAREP